MAVASVPAVLILGSLAAAAAFSAGAWAALGRSIPSRWLHVLLGAATGLLLTAALTEMLPEALEADPRAGWVTALAFLALVGIEVLLGGHGAHGHGHDPPEEREAAWSGPGRLAAVALLALSFHRLAGGLTLPAALGLEATVGLPIVVAVLVHQVPDGLAAGAIFLASGWSRRRILAGLGLVALWVPVGALAGLALDVIGALWLLLSISAATFLFIGAVELLPELQEGPHRLSTAAGVVAGVALVLLTEIAVGHV